MFLTLLLALLIDGNFCANNTFGGSDSSEIVIDTECLNSRFNAKPLNQPASSTLIYCADENGFCDFQGTKTVTYGVLDVATTTGVFENGVECSNQIFGDPIHGTVKKCYFEEMENVISAFDYPCVNAPFKEFLNFGLSDNSPAIGAGTEIAGFTCPLPGHPGDGECLEWFNKPGPDIGACQAVYLSKSIVIEIID